jgi:hypothetical protein
MEMDKLVSRTDRLIGAITEGILSTVEAASQRIELAAQVAQVKVRMEAFGAVLEAVGAQRAVLEERRVSAGPAVRALIGRQLELLAAQEVAILSQAGIGEDVARQALTVVEQSAEQVYVRQGRRFTAVNGRADAQ